ncbi:PAAR domain-containing protein [Pseudomonas cichorii]|uniref:PAAR domain-containing protein n=1 Tax=Pseudomonas cichorii TaxID=36746 RepID=UPI000EFE75EB|nr:PAAR domain-containing protein [Pseudomonas cichorii]
MPFVVKEGDPTTTGGFVLSASATELIDQRRVARMGDPVWCPACKSVGYIAEGNPTYINGCVAVATHGHQVKCGCPTGSNRLAASQEHSRADMEATITIPDEMVKKALSTVERITSSIKAGTFDSPLFKTNE